MPLGTTEPRDIEEPDPFTQNRRKPVHRLKSRLRHVGVWNMLGPQRPLPITRTAEHRMTQIPNQLQTPYGRTPCPNTIPPSVGTAVSELHVDRSPAV